MENPIASFNGFGYREMDLAADLLKRHADTPADFLGDEISIGFNPNSGNVYMFDENENVAMFDDNGKLSQFLICLECGAEGFTLDCGHTQ